MKIKSLFEGSHFKIDFVPNIFGFNYILIFFLFLLMGVMGCVYRQNSVQKNAGQNTEDNPSVSQGYAVTINADIPSKTPRKGTCRIILPYSLSNYDQAEWWKDYENKGIKCVTKALEYMGYTVLPGYLYEKKDDGGVENPNRSYFGDKTDIADWDIFLSIWHLAGDAKTKYFPVYGTTGYSAHTDSIVPGESDTTIEPVQGVVGAEPLTVFDSMEYSMDIDADRIKNRHSSIRHRYDDKRSWFISIKSVGKINDCLKDSKVLPSIMVGAALPLLSKKAEGSSKTSVTITSDDPNVLYFNQQGTANP